MNKQLRQLGETFWDATVGNIFSPSPLEPHDILITLKVHSAKLVRSSNGTVTGATFLGRNFTITELCMCTDYSPPVDGQIPLPLELPQDSSGGYFLKSLGVHKCDGCRKTRPSHITAVSTSVRN